MNVSIIYGYTIRQRLVLEEHWELILKYLLVVQYVDVYNAVIRCLDWSLLSTSELFFRRQWILRINRLLFCGYFISAALRWFQQAVWQSHSVALVLHWCLWQLECSCSYSIDVCILQPIMSSLYHDVFLPEAWVMAGCAWMRWIRTAMVVKEKLNKKKNFSPTRPMRQVFLSIKLYKRFHTCS